MVEAPANEFLGLATAYWQAIATFLAPLVAGTTLAFLGVRLAGRRLRQELQGKDAREHFLNEGLDKLAAAYDQMLGATRMNYAVCVNLINTLKEYDQNHPTAPRSDDLPSLTPTITDTTAFAAITPSSQIMDFPELGGIATKAFAGIIGINLSFLVQIWLPIRAYYSKERPDCSLDREEAFARLAELANRNYMEAEGYMMLPRLLTHLSLRAREVGFNSFEDFWRLRKDDEFIRLRNQMRTFSNQMMQQVAPSSVEQASPSPPPVS